MNYSRTFKDKAVLQEMLYLRLQGWPLEELAFRYGCNHTSIIKACKRNGLPNEVPVLPRPLLIFRRVRFTEDNERINPGKTYQEYLKESKRHIIVQIRGLK